MKTLLIVLVALLTACGEADFTVAATPDGSAGMLGDGDPDTSPPSIKCPHGYLTVTGLPETSLDHVTIYLSAEYEPHSGDDGTLVAMVDTMVNGIRVGSEWELSDGEDGMMYMRMSFRGGESIVSDTVLSATMARYHVEGTEDPSPIESTSCWAEVDGGSVASWPID